MGKDAPKNQNLVVEVKLRWDEATSSFVATQELVEGVQGGGETQADALASILTRLAAHSDLLAHMARDVGPTAPVQVIDAMRHGTLAEIVNTRLQVFKQGGGIPLDELAQVLHECATIAGQVDKMLATHGIEHNARAHHFTAAFVEAYRRGKDDPKPALLLVPRTGQKEERRGRPKGRHRKKMSG